MSITIEKEEHGLGEEYRFLLKLQYPIFCLGKKLNLHCQNLLNYDNGTFIGDL